MGDKDTGFYSPIELLIQLDNVCIRSVPLERVAGAIKAEEKFLGHARDQSEVKGESGREGFATLQEMMDLKAACLNGTSQHGDEVSSSQSTKREIPSLP